LTYWAFHLQNSDLFSGFLYLYWISLSYPALHSLLQSAVYFLWIHPGVCVLFNFVDHSYNHSFEFVGISSISLSLETVIVELLTFRRTHIALFFHILFLHWDLFIWGQVIGWRFLYSLIWSIFKFMQDWVGQDWGTFAHMLRVLGLIPSTTHREKN
jgi:hypothetical protein